MSRFISPSLFENSQLESLKDCCIGKDGPIYFLFSYKGERYSECTTTIFDPDENEKEFKDLAKECDCEDTEQANEGRNQLTGLAGLAGKGKGGKDEDDPCICYCENRRTGGGLLGYQGSKRRGRPRTGLGAYGRAGSSGLGGLGGRTGLGGLGNTGLGGYGNGGTSGLGNTGLGGYGRGGTSGLGGLGSNTGLGGYGTAGLAGGRTGLGSYGQRGTSGLGGLGGRTGLGGYGAGGTSGLGGLGGRTGLGGLGNGGSQTALGGIRQSGLGGFVFNPIQFQIVLKKPDFRHWRLFHVNHCKAARFQVEERRQPRRGVVRHCPQQSWQGGKVRLLFSRIFATEILLSTPFIRNTSICAFGPAVCDKPQNLNNTESKFGEYQIRYFFDTKHRYILIMIHCSLYSGGKSVVLAAPGSSQRTPLGPILNPLHVQKGRDDYFSFETLILPC